MIGALKRADEVDVVLDDDRGDALLGDQPLHELAGCGGLLGGHTGGRLVEQQELGVVGEQQPDLEPLPLAVGEIAGEHLRLVLEPHQLEHVFDSRPDVAWPPCGREHGELGVLVDALVVEHARRLELAPDAAAGARRHRQRRDRLALIPDRAGGRPEMAGDHADERGLAGAVRPDDAAQLAAREPEIDRVVGEQALEALGQALGAQELGHRPQLRRPAASSRATAPATPPLRNRITSTNRMPSASCQ